MLSRYVSTERPRCDRCFLGAGDTAAWKRDKNSSELTCVCKPQLLSTEPRAQISVLLVVKTQMEMFFQYYSLVHRGKYYHYFPFARHL